ncbi:MULTISPECIES: poly(ethylene terephthalate) hydrolase family protein [unclassified Methylobacterium]|jgi:acetyl esterase/lipase|uniref:poly(ethylene terephthalate) hydrolase family protein n=1 Tax=unclassified Methylobacterium TaxID=2615210 RepID=UPI0013541FE3|nr:alpha/beta hydrolase [Methylobacterium sp. 2A]MWV22718.1 alpha/beta hydrolase [Methylobacterium sp. 2A]
MRLPAIRASLAAAAIMILAGTLSAEAATPPPQPADGAGGVGDRKATVVKRLLGRGATGTYAFYTAGPAPEAGRPVAVFLHGWGIVNPQSYGAWIDHLARQGWLVILPRFQEVNRTRPADAPANAESLVKAALADLAADSEAKPDLGRVAMIGHLAGAPMAMDLAADAKARGLPVPKLVFAVTPGGIASGAKSRGIALGDLSAIDPATIIVTMVGDKDTRAADFAAKRLLREASSVPVDRKLFVRILSDDHGFPALTATLAAPAGVDTAYDGGAIKPAPEPKDAPKDTPRPPPFRWSPDMALTGEQQTLVSQVNVARVDALDYLGFWKTFDLAAAAAFAGSDATVLKNNPRLADMERWSDGWPVKRLAVETPRPAPAAQAKPAAEARPAAPSRGR